MARLDTSVFARRRLIAAAGGLAGVVVLVVVLALALGSDGPADDASALVPADALAYARIDLDPESERFRAASELAERVPILSGQIAGRLLAGVPGPAGRAPDFPDEIAPWFGGEAALVLVAATGAGGVRTEEVHLLEVSDPAAAEAYADDVLGAASTTSEYGGVELRVGERDVAVALLDGFLVLGAPDGVRGVIDAGTGAEGSTAIANEEGPQALREELPEDRFADAYLAPDGIEALAGSPLGGLAALVEPQASEGAALALTASGDALELSVRSELDPESAEATPGFFSAFPAFEPELPSRLDAETIAYLGIGEPAEAVTALFDQALAEAPEIARGFERLLSRLERDAGVEVSDRLLGSLGSEAAFTLEQRSPEAGETGPAGPAGPAGLASLPYLAFTAEDVDEDAAREALAALGARAQGSEEREIGGVEARTLRLSPTVELTYAVFEGLVSIATDPQAIGRLTEGEGGFSGSELYRSATEGLADSPSMLVVLDLGELVATGERLGLAEDPLYATFAGEFRRLEVLGLAVESSSEEIATEARLILGD